MHIKAFIPFIRTVMYLALVVVTFQVLVSQQVNLGQPPVFAFAKKVTKGGTQTWAIKDDCAGNTWFANNAGLLRYDGSSWELYRLPSGTIVRSLELGDKNHIYVGGQGEFGYFTPDSRGRYRFTSLSAALPERDKNFGDVWHVVRYGNKIFFRTDHQLFEYDGNRVSALFYTPVTLNFIGLFGPDLVIQDESNRLFRYDGHGFTAPYTPAFFDKGRISGVINIHPDTVLVTTIDQGIFYKTGNKFNKWSTDNDRRLKSQIIYCATTAGPTGIVAGTSFAGISVLDKKGRMTYSIGKESGLPNNTILSVCGTPSGNVWVGTDNGIALINFSMPVKFIYPDGNLEGTGYDAIKFEDRLYLATNTGLYTIKWKDHYRPEEKSRFTQVSGSSGQVWGLQSHHGRLLMSHHNGGYLVEGFSAVKIQNSPQGVWKFIENNPAEILIGHYSGISLCKSLQLSPSSVFSPTNVKHSSRIMYKGGDGRVWMSHPYRGLYSIESGDDGQYRAEKFNKGPLSFLTNNLYLIHREIVVHNDTSFFKIIPDKDSIAPLTLLNGFINLTEGLKFLMEDTYGNLWYSTHSETGLLIPSSGFEKSYKKYLVNYFNDLLVEGFQKVYVIDPENVLLPTEKGFIHFNPAMYLADSSTFKISLASISIKSTPDSTVFYAVSCHAAVAENFEFGPRDKNLVFRFATCDNTAFDHVTYRYKLSGVSESWSDWTENPVITYNNLASGQYNLTVQARNGFGKISNEVTCKFHILSPWYKSGPAYLFYTFCLVVFMIYLLKKQDLKHRADKDKIHTEIEMKEMMYRQQAELSQLEINKLKNEKLEAEIKSKNNELTSYTYHLVNKNDLIQKIREELSYIEHKVLDQADIKKELRNVIRMVDNNEEIDEDWENFIKSFDQVHADFYKRLNKRFADLSPTDYKLCTYLRMNLTSKEIASLMNISLRSVETNRYRLRKKLNLDHDENLTQFILKF